MTRPIETWEMEREIVLSRVFDAPRERVFRAWTDPQRIGAWFAPKDFTCRIRHADIRVGGSLRFDFVGPEGLVYDNRVTYIEITAPSPKFLPRPHASAPWSSALSRPSAHAPADYTVTPAAANTARW